MRSALATDTLRTIRNSAKRFVSLAAICVLGVTMLVGLTIACRDLRLSADKFFDQQRLYDASVQSTLGLTEDDVNALAALDSVEEAEGSWSETAYTTIDGAHASVSVNAFETGGMNQPYLEEGHLPENADEVAVTRDYLDATGKRVGDTLAFGVNADDTTWAPADTAQPQTDADDDAEDLDSLELDSEDERNNELFARHAYTITACVTDPTNVSAKNGSSSFRSSGPKYSFFVPASAATAEAYSVVYLRAAGAAELSCFSQKYKNVMDRVTSDAEGIKAEREVARDAEIRGDANARIDDAEQTANDRFAEAEDKLAEAQKAIDDAIAQIESGRSELAEQKASALDQLAEAQAKIDSGRAQLEDPATRDQAVEQAKAAAICALEESDQYKQLVSTRDALVQTKQNYDALVDAKAQLEETQGQLETAIGQLKQGKDELETARNTLEQRIAQLKALGLPTDELEAKLTEVEGKIAKLDTQLAEVEARRAQVEAQLGTVNDGITTITAALSLQSLTPEALEPTITQLEAGMAAARQQAEDAAVAEVERSIAESRAQLDQGQAELDSSRAELDAQLAAAQAKLDDAQSEVDGGTDELEENRAEFERQKAETLRKIADARAKVEAIRHTTWYVQDRGSISCFSSIDTDASCIETLGFVFPVIFLVVAILVALTTAMRMVEEERGLIGLYKALGYHRGSIMAKYVLYTAGAALAGGIVGAILGFVALPLFLFKFFALMYTLPAFELSFSPALCALAMGIFVLGIGATTALTVSRELTEQPAQLMRPRAPKAGKRILLERMPVIWNHLGFLNKVTARNLFRYKGRLAMTVFGVAGCCALMIAGFAINDTVEGLSANQYGGNDRAGVYSYDLLAVTRADDLEEAARELTQTPEVATYTCVYTDNVTVERNGSQDTAQLIVVPDGFPLDGFINLRGEDGTSVSLDDAARDGGALFTKSAANVLGFGTGDEVTLKDTKLNQASVKASGVVMSYLGNTVYMTQSTYEKLFGEKLEANALIANLLGTDDEKIDFCNRLANDTRYLNITNVRQGVRDFSDVFILIRCVTALLIVLAAGLSFVVLFTLSATNVSERERELATIKVLGFRRGEVRTYINKEMLILTFIGTVLGVPLGLALSQSLTHVLNMPSMYFAVEVAPAGVIISCALSLAFAVIVCLITRPSIDRIDMVGALKSAE